MYSQNFAYSKDPFGMFTVRGSGGFMGFKPPKKKSNFWEIILFVFGIILIVLMIFFRDVVWEIFFPKSKEVNPTKTESKIVKPKVIQTEVIQTEIIPKIPFKLLPEWKVIKRYDIADEATWDNELILAKFDEGKAKFIKNKGWLIYG